MSESSIDTVDIFYEELGRLIRQARTAARLTQADLAERIAFTRSSVANLEAGRQRVPVHVFAAIESALGVKPGELLPRDMPRRGASFEEVLDRHLAEAPETTREFVEGAMARLDAAMTDQPTSHEKP